MISKNKKMITIYLPRKTAEEFEGTAQACGLTKSKIMEMAWAYIGEAVDAKPFVDYWGKKTGEQFFQALHNNKGGKQ